MMLRHVVEVPGCPTPRSPYSNAVVANGFVFVSGQVGARADGGPMDPTMQGQTRQALDNVRAVLEACGSSVDRIVKVTVLLARPETFAEMNEAYGAYFSGPKPARAVTRLGPEIPGVLVSIEAVATVG